jgi:hypothetical protein
MPQQPLTDSERADTTQFRHRLSAEIPTIKILLYADDPDDVTLSSSKLKPLSLGLMRAHLMAHEPASARFSIEYVCRYGFERPPTINKLDSVLEQERFDQIWFFGLHQANLEKFSLSIFQGGPQNELDEDEVLALRRWMQANEAEGFPGGGVLMTGDHSNKRPTKAAPSTNPACPDPNGGEDLLGLGRALGRCVPRGGMLRTWECSPTNRPGDTLNTVETLGTESDEKPQRLILQNVNEEGDPDENGQPHPLFHYKPGRWIEVFPDHDHEGALDRPKSFDPDVWPLGLNGQPQPQPHVVAYGINQRTSERIDIIAAYHGDRAGVGRIVADSTWHHYFNRNLRRFQHPAPEGSPSDQIGQFYANLAVWLSPRSKQREMAHALFWELAKYTLRLERVPDDPEPESSIGQATYNIVSQVASPCEVHELMQAVAPERFRACNFPEKRFGFSELPSRELLLGSIMCSYHKEMIQADNEDDYYVPLEADEVIVAGFNRAFEKHIEQLQLKTESARKLFQ